MRAVQTLLDDVQLDAAGRPVRFRQGGRLHHVSAQLDAWRFGGRWWLGEAPRDCFLVQTGQQVAELHHERPDLSAPGRWWLARVLD